MCDGPTLGIAGRARAHRSPAPDRQRRARLHADGRRGLRSAPARPPARPRALAFVHRCMRAHRKRVGATVVAVHALARRVRAHARAGAPLGSTRRRCGCARACPDACARALMRASVSSGLRVCAARRVKSPAMADRAFPSLRCACRSPIVHSIRALPAAATLCAMSAAFLTRRRVSPGLVHIRAGTHPHLRRDLRASAGAATAVVHPFRVPARSHPATGDVSRTPRRTHIGARHAGRDRRGRRGAPLLPPLPPRPPSRLPAPPAHPAE
jgi:hypothetical protein